MSRAGKLSKSTDMFFELLMNESRGVTTEILADEATSLNGWVTYPFWAISRKF